MKIRCNATLILALLMSLCLVTFIPAGLRNASTWKEFEFKYPGAMRLQNYLMPLGFLSLGLVMIGLIVLWTGYRKRERWAWFVMLIQLMFFVFPLNVLYMLSLIWAHGYQWSILSYLFEAFREEGWWRCLTITTCANQSGGIECGAVGIAIGILVFLVMLIALLSPVKAFFWRQPGAQVKTESLHKEA